MDQWLSEREKAAVLSDAHGHLAHGGGSLLPSPLHALRRSLLACATDPIDAGIFRNTGFLWTCWTHQLVLARRAGTTALLLRRRPYLHAPYQLWIRTTETVSGVMSCCCWNPSAQEDQRCQCTLEIDIYIQTVACKTIVLNCRTAFKDIDQDTWPMHNLQAYVYGSKTNIYSKEIDRKRTLHICPTWHRSRSLWNPPPEAHWNEQILLQVEKNRKMFRSDHDKERCQDRMDRNHNVRSSHLCSLTDTFCSCCWAKTYVHAIRSWWGTDIALATSILYHINNKFNLHFQNKISPDHIQIQKKESYLFCI